MSEENLRIVLDKTRWIMHANVREREKILASVPAATCVARSAISVRERRILAVEIVAFESMEHKDKSS